MIKKKRYYDTQYRVLLMFARQKNITRGTCICKVHTCYVVDVTDCFSLCTSCNRCDWRQAQGHRGNVKCIRLQRVTVYEQQGKTPYDLQIFFRKCLPAWNRVTGKFWPCSLKSPMSLPFNWTEVADKLFVNIGKKKKSRCAQWGNYRLSIK